MLMIMRPCGKKKPQNENPDLRGAPDQKRGCRTAKGHSTGEEIIESRQDQRQGELKRERGTFVPSEINSKLKGEKERRNSQEGRTIVENGLRIKGGPRGHPGAVYG